MRSLGFRVSVVGVFSRDLGQRMLGGNMLRLVNTCESSN